MDDLSKEVKIVFLEIVPVLIILFGLIGNLLTFIVYSSKELEKLPVNIYFRFLSITDSLNLLIYLPLLIKFVFEHDFQIISDTTCKFFVYISFAMPSMSVFVLIILSLDRAICVKYPNNKLFRQKKSQIISIVIITLFNMGIYTAVGFSYTKEATLNYTVCACRQVTVCNIIKWIDVFNAFILPFLIMISCSFIVIIQIRKSKLRIETHQLSRQNSHCLKSSNALLHNKNVQFACVSFGLNLVFLVCNLPITIYQLKHFDYYDEGVIDEHLFYSLAELIFYAHFGLSFFVHVLFNIKFRSELARLIIHKLMRGKLLSRKPLQKPNDTSKNNSNSHF